MSGQGQEPSSKELEFVYSLILEGKTVQEIMDKYQELSRHGKLGDMPLRTDKKRFVPRMRRHFEAARQVLKSRGEVSVFVVNHWKDLARVADYLADEWARFIRSSNLPMEMYIVDESILDDSQVDAGYIRERFLIHFKKEFPGEFDKLVNWRDMLTAPPAPGFLDKIDLIRHRRTFENSTCQICEKWSVNKVLP